MQHAVVKRAGLGLALLAFVPAAWAQPESGKEKSLNLRFEAPVVVVAGDAFLTEADLRAHVESIPPEDRAGFVNNPRRIADTAEQQTRQELLARKAQEAGMLDDPVRSARLYRSAIEQLARWQMEEVIAERKLEDYEQQGRELYLSNPERFSQGRSYSFTHLLVAVAERSEEEAMRKVLSLADQLDEGADFGELIAAHSDDGTVAENGGTYESVPPDQLDSNFSNALRRLEPGEMSGPVRSRFGWHLIRLDEVHEGEVKDWEAAREEAIKLAEQRHAERIREAYLVELSSSRNLEVSQDIVTRLQQRYGSLRGQSSQP